MFHKDYVRKICTHTFLNYYQVLEFFCLIIFVIVFFFFQFFYKHVVQRAEKITHFKYQLKIHNHYAILHDAKKKKYIWPA